MIDFSPQQSAAIKSVSEWQKDKKSPQIFRLFGFAGTGKTTLAKEVAASVDGDVLFGAFTGKAASVMRQKGCKDASTIHSMIYDVEEGVNGEPRFTLKPRHKSEVADSKLVIIDECSMVDEELARDLMSYGTKILVLGDPAQLPPVKGTGFFTEAHPDAMLTEVHRQARENPIIALSMKIRTGGAFEMGTWGGCRVIGREEIKPEEVLGVDQVIVGLNRTRTLYNKRIRELLHRPPEAPVRGDKLICLRNDRQKKIFNGGLWKAESVKKDKKHRPIFHMKVGSLDEDGQSRGIQVRQEFFSGCEAELPWQEKKGTQEFTYGYAITCHKSQGSQWDNVLVFNESQAFREEARRWAYTAITRAAQKLTVVI